MAQFAGALDAALAAVALSTTIRADAGRSTNGRLASFLAPCAHHHLAAPSSGLGRSTR